MKVSRRPLFFFGVGLVCLVLVPFTPAEFRWVNYAMFGLAIFWTIVLGLEELVNLREGERRRNKFEP
jgi:intracellular septation protein A